MWCKKKQIGMTEATRRIGISSERLRYWELKGVVAPAYEKRGTKNLRRFSLEDVEIAREIKRMVDTGGFTLKGAAERMNRPYQD